MNEPGGGGPVGWLAGYSVLELGSPRGGLGGRLWQVPPSPGRQLVQGVSPTDTSTSETLSRPVTSAAADRRSHSLSALFFRHRFFGNYVI